MKRTKTLENIGTVVASEIELSDTTIGMYIPIKSESDIIREKREKFQSWVMRDAKVHSPETNFDECTLFTETDLFINTSCCDEKGRYKLYFSIGFIMWYEDSEGNEVYWDMSEHYDIDLSEEDKAYIKKIIALKIVDAMM